MTTTKSIREKLRGLQFVPFHRGPKGNDLLNLRPSRRVELPADYEEFIREFGGGWFEKDVAVVCDEPPPAAEGDLCLLGEFLDSGNGETALETVWRRNEELITDGVVPIATGAGGNLFCFSEQAGNAVVFWDHDSNECYRVAESFAAFIDHVIERQAPGRVDLDKIELTLDPDLLK